MTIPAIRRRLPFLVNSGYATLTAGSAALLLGLLLVAGRLLSAADYGRFSYALALTTIIETVMDIGLGPVTVRTVAREKTSAEQLFRHVLGLKLVWVALGLGLLFVVAPILRSDRELIRLCYLMGISSAVRSYMLTSRGLLQGLDRFDVEAAIVVADRVLLLVSGTALLFGRFGLFGLAFAFVGSRLVMLLAVTVLLNRLLGSVAPRFDRDVWRDLQAAALPLGFSIIVLNLYTYIDTVILGVMKTDAEVGWYAAAYRIYEGLTYAPSILAAVLTPRLSYLFAHDRAAHRSLLLRSFTGSVALGVVMGAAAAWAARPILTLLFGAAYLPGVAPLQILAGGALFLFGTFILHAGAISTNLDRGLLLTTVVGLGTNVLLNILFIPRFGISGAAWATVLAEMVTVTLLFVQLRHRLSRP